MTTTLLVNRPIIPSDQHGGSPRGGQAPLFADLAIPVRLTRLVAWKP
jgi:hypothetical protein